MAQDRGKSSKAPKEPLLEWIAAGLGLVVAVGMLSVIGAEAWRGDAAAPPALEVRAERIVPVPGGFLVKIVVANRSGGTAAAVQVEGALKQGDVPVETSSLTFDYVPGHAERKGGLFFTRDPRRHQLEVRPMGYQAP